MRWFWQKPEACVAECQHLSALRDHQARRDEEIMERLKLVVEESRQARLEVRAHWEMLMQRLDPGWTPPLGTRLKSPIGEID